MFYGCGRLQVAPWRSGTLSMWMRGESFLENKNFLNLENYSPLPDPVRHRELHVRVAKDDALVPVKGAEDKDLSVERDEDLDGDDLFLVRQLDLPLRQEIRDPRRDVVAGHELVDTGIDPGGCSRDGDGCTPCCGLRRPRAGMPVCPLFHDGGVKAAEHRERLLGDLDGHGVIEERAGEAGLLELAANEPRNQVHALLEICHNARWADKVICGSVCDREVATALVELESLDPVDVGLLRPQRDPVDPDTDAGARVFDRGLFAQHEQAVPGHVLPGRREDEVRGLRLPLDEDRLVLCDLRGCPECLHEFFLLVCDPSFVQVPSTRRGR